MTKAYVNLNAGNFPIGNPWSYNEFWGAGTYDTVGTLSSDLLDDAGASTGWGLDVVTVFSTTAGSGGSADSGAGGWPEGAFYHYWAKATITTLRLTGLPVGNSYTIEVAGHAKVAGISTDHTVEGVTKNYADSGTTTPTAPNVWAGTVPAGGNIDIDSLKVVGTVGVINGFTVEITASSSIDTATDPTVDQVESEITTTGLTGTASATLGGKALTLGGSFAAEPLTFTTDIAGLEDETTGPDIGSVQTLVVTGDEGSPSTTLTTAVKSGWSVTTLAGTLNTGDGGMIKAMNDALTAASLPTKTIVVGDRMYFDAADSSAVADDSTYTGDANSYVILLGQGGSSTTVTTWTPFLALFDIPVDIRINFSTIAQYLRDNQGFTGSTNDVIHKWLVGVLGISNKSTNDLWMRYLSTRTITSHNSFGDRFHDWKNQ